VLATRREQSSGCNDRIDFQWLSNVDNVRVESQTSWAQLTPSSSSPSSRCRGMTVTISISQRKAISGGVKPGGNGKAIQTVNVLL